ncbi:MAG: EamA family transporter [Xanthomonadales bacterium]
MTKGPVSTPPGAERVGVAAALAAYIFWGLAPIYFKLIQSVDALEIIAHRILWSIPFLAAFLLLRDGRSFWQRMRLPRRTVLTLLLSGALVVTNCSRGCRRWGW